MPSDADRTGTAPAGSGVDVQEDSTPPVHVHLTVWLDRDPEVFAPGLAPWLVRAALEVALESLEDTDEEAEKDSATDEEEGEDD